MKRINPSTGKTFKRGDTREDGFRFHHYRMDRPVLANGLFTESWYSPEAFAKQDAIIVACRERNREKAKQYTKNWQKENPEKVNAYAMQRRTAKLQRMPPWLTDAQKQEIEDFYFAAKELEKIFPWKQHVDHIVPLRGKTVLGLHVPWNLQILPATENIIKNNRF